jgi:hypothetical protein
MSVDSCHALVNQYTNCTVKIRHLAGPQLPTLRRNLQPPFSGPKIPRNILRILEDDSRYGSVGIATRYGMNGLGDRIPGEGEIFRSHPHRPLGPPSLLYNGYRVSLPGVKRPGRGADYSPPLVLRLRKENSYTSTPPLGLLGRLYREIYLLSWQIWNVINTAVRTLNLTANCTLFLWRLDSCGPG